MKKYIYLLIFIAAAILTGFVHADVNWFGLPSLSVVSTDSAVYHRIGTGYFRGPSGGGGGGSGDIAMADYASSALTSNSSSYAVNLSSKISSTKTISNNTTAVSFSFTNFSDGAFFLADYSKTTASDATLTFPSGSIVSDQNGNETAGLSSILTSSTTGRFLIQVKKIGSSYFVSIKRYKA